MFLAAAIFIGISQTPPSFERREPKSVPREELNRAIPQPVSQTTPAGGGIFVDFEIDYRQFDSDPVFMTDLTCINSCRGDKHGDHVACDETCDDVCETKHDIPIEPETFINGGFGQMLSNFFKQVEGTKKVGFYPRRGLGSSHAVDKHIQRVSLDFITKNLKRKKEASLTPSKEHWNKESCSYQVKEVYCFVYYMYIKYTVRDAFETIASGESFYAEIYIPDPEVEDRPVELNCKCAGEEESSFNQPDFPWPIPLGDMNRTRTRPTTGTTPVEKEEPKEKPTKTSGLFLEDEDGMRVATAGAMANLGIEVVCSSMNRVDIAFTNNWETSARIGLTPGSLLVPEDNKYQNIIVAAPITLEFASKETIFVSIDYKAPFSLAGGFALCADMYKKPPDGKVKYKVQAATDQRMIDIAAVVSRSGFRGPWHQAMMWIYTDGATYKEINDVLIPGISQRQYVNAMYDLAERCVVDFSDRKYEDCFDTALLDVTTVKSGAASWFVSQLPQRDLKRWLDRAKTKARAWVDGDDEQLSHLVALLSAVTYREELDLHIAAARMLEGMSVDQINKIADAGGLDGVAALLFSKDGKAMDAALDLFEKARSQYSWSFLQNLDEGVSRRDRDRATKLLEDLEKDDAA